MRLALLLSLLCVQSFAMDVLRTQENKKGSVKNMGVSDSTFRFQELGADFGEEIERRASDNRFVSVLVLAQGDALLGKRHFWPVWQAAMLLVLEMFQLRAVRSSRFWERVSTPSMCMVQMAWEI